MSTSILYDILEKSNIKQESLIVKKIQKRSMNTIFTVSYLNQEKIIKISHSKFKDTEIGGNAFVKEKKLLEILRGKHLPVPEVACIGNVSGKEYIIMNKLEGVPIDDVFWLINDSEKLCLIKQLCEYLKRIYTVSFNFCGNIESDFEQQIQLEDWKNYLINRLDSYMRYNSNSKMVNKITQLKNRVEIFDGFKCNQLIHNDLGLRADNILVKRDGGKWEISGLIDWERAKSGDPLEEISRLESELLKSWLFHNINSKDLIYQTNILNIDLFNFFSDFKEYKEQIEWYRDYVLCIPGKWYLMK